MRDRAPGPTGHVTLRVWRDGALHHEEHGRNLVVDSAAVVLARLAAGVGSIASIGVGTNGTAPAAVDTALTGAFTRPLIGRSNPVPGSVTFTWRIPAEEAPTLTVRELGLLSEAGVLVARKTLTTPQPITSGVELEGEWTLTW